MKTRIDLFSSFQNKFLASKRLKGRLRRYWGTESIDGVEVFKDKLTIYPGTTSTNVQGVLGIFGMKKSIAEQDFSGVESYYLYLNANKVGGYGEFEADVLANKINQYFDQDVTYRININIADASDPLKFKDWTDTEIYDYVDAGYSTFIDNDYIEARGDTMAEEVAGIYILLDDDTHFTIDTVSAQVMPIKHTKTVSYGASQTYYTSSISVTLDVTRTTDVIGTSTIIASMQAENDQLRTKHLSVLQNSSYNYGIDDDDWSSSEVPAVTDSIWYKGQLRVATTDSYYLKRDEFSDLVASSLDTGYVKKKVKWWKKVLAFVILIIAIILVPYTGGQSLLAFAAYMGTLSLVMVAIQFALAKSGDEAMASAMGPVVQITGFVSTVAGIGAFLQNMAKSALMEGIKAGMTAGAMAEAAYAGIKAAVVDTLTTTVTTQSTAIIGGVERAVTTTVTELAYQKVATMALKIVNYLGDMRNKMKAKQLDAVQEQIAQAAEELEDLQDKSVHLGVEDIKFSTQPLKLDNIQFEVDYQYEGTKFNILRPSFYSYGLNVIT